MTRRTYAEQLARTRRSYERFGEIDQGRVHDRDSEHYRDEIYSFFQNCYHLKDWLKNDPSHLFAPADVEAFVDANRELRLCADICNGSKHLTLLTERSNESPRLGSQHFKMELGSGPPTVSVKYTLDIDSGILDAFEVATQCLDLWRNFIRAHGGTA